MTSLSLSCPVRVAEASVSMTGDCVNEKRPTGRPQTRTDEEILGAALRAFAMAGYEAMSIRTLNKDLGLSHEAVRQRFGSKEQLYRVAVEWGIAEFNRYLSAERTHQSTDLDILRESIRAFIVTARQHQDLGRLILRESLERSERMDSIFAWVFEPNLAGIKALLDRLAQAGQIQPISVREYFFLAQGAAAPFARMALSDAFDPVAGPLDPAAYIARVVDIIMQGIAPPST